MLYFIKKRLWILTVHKRFLVISLSLYTFSASATLDSAQWKCPAVLPTAKELRNSQFFSVVGGIVAFPLHAVKGRS